MKFIKHNEFGHTVYKSGIYSATETNGRLYVSKNRKPMYNAGFVNIDAVEDYIESADFYDEILKSYGFEKQNDDLYEYKLDGTSISAKYDTYKQDWTIMKQCENTPKTYTVLVEDAETMKEELDNLMTENIIEDDDYSDIPITAAISTKNITDTMIKVDSSNMWSYGFNVKNYGDKTGDMFIQFKGRNGGPGEVYQYFDVPVSLWRRFVSAPSKGHFFYVNVRSKFKYRKLTGDKKGKFSNAVN